MAIIIPIAQLFENNLFFLLSLKILIVKIHFFLSIYNKKIWKKI